MRQSATVLALGTLLAGALWAGGASAQGMGASACRQECESQRMACVEWCGRQGDPVECEAQCDDQAEDCADSCRD
jgi:hypothetical protein